MLSKIFELMISTECVNSSVARFARKFLSKFPRPVGHTTAAAKQEQNCKRNLYKNFLANLASKQTLYSCGMSTFDCKVCVHRTAYQKFPGD